MRYAVKGMMLGLVALLALAPGGKPVAEQPERKASERSFVAADGVPYDNGSSQKLMQMKPLTGNLLRNGGFEAGRYWPYGWEATDGLTTFWGAGGTDGRRCLKIYTDVLDSQWKRRDAEVRTAVADAGGRTAGKPQSLEDDPVPPAPERIPTEPPYYNTVGGVHGVHYRSDYIPVKPGAVYRFSIDARAEAVGEPKVFIKGFFDQKMKTRDGVQTVRRNAYRAPMTLDPCDGQWRRYARLFHPWKSKSTLDDKPLKPEFLQVQIYAYWKPGGYYFDNCRLEIVGYEKPEPAPEPAVASPSAKEKKKPPRLDEHGYPIFDP